MAMATVAKLGENTERVPSVLCDHMLVEVMGVSKAATYLRCKCGVLLVAQDGDMWVLGTAFK